MQIINLIHKIICKQCSIVHSLSSECLSFELVNEIHYFVLNDTFSINTSLIQKSNIRRILNKKLSRSNDNFFVKNKSNYYLAFLFCFYSICYTFYIV